MLNENINQGESDSILQSPDTNFQHHEVDLQQPTDDVVDLTSQKAVVQQDTTTNSLDATFVHQQHGIHESQITHRSIQSTTPPTAATSMIHTGGVGGVARPLKQSSSLLRDMGMRVTSTTDMTLNATMTDREKQMFRIKNQVSFFAHEGAHFLYNTRIILVLLACIIPFLSLTGKYSLALLATGFKVVYVLDFLEQKTYSFYAFWSTLAIFWFSVYISSIGLLFISPFNVFVLFQGSMFVMTIGIWGSLNFQFLRSKAPEVTLLAERYLFASIPFVSLPLILSLIVGLNGVKNSPFYLSVVMCCMIHMFLSPLKSSFKEESKIVSSKSMKDALLLIQRPIECQIYCALTLVLPSMVYIAIHHRILALSMGHFVNLAILIAVPLLFFCSRPQRYLWWYWNRSDSNGTTNFLLRLVVASLSLILIIIWLEYRVIFRRYPYLLAIPAPYNFMVITIALYSMISVVLFSLAGIVNWATKLMSVCICTFSAACLSFVLGLPLWMSPVPAAAAYFGSAFFFSRSWEQYIAFGITSAVSLILWLATSFWFVDYEFELSFLPIEWSMRVSHCTVLIVMFVVLCVFVFPACVKNTSKPLTFYLVVAQALVLTFLEQMLYEQGEGFYSTLLVVMTSAVGCLLSLRLYECDRLELQAASVLLAIYVSKISVLFSGSVRMAFGCSFITSIALAHMYLVSRSGERLSHSICWSYFVGSGATLFITRHYVLKLVLQAFIDVRFYDITESHLIGATLFTWGIALLPLSVNYMKNVPIVQRANILVSVLGAVWGLWQPSIEGLLAEDFSNMTDFASLSLWVLIAITVVFVLLMVLNIGSVNRFAPFRIIALVCISLSIAISFSATYLNHSSIIASILLCLSAVFGAATDFASGTRIAGSYVAVFVAYGLHLLCMPFIYLLVDSVQVESGTSAQDVVRTARIALLALYAVISILLSISIRFKIRFLEDYKNNDESGVRDIGLVGNFCTIVGYILSIALTTWLGPENIYTVYIALSGIFLLLNKDNILPSAYNIEWTESHRYTLTLVVMQITMFTLFILDTVSLFTDFHVVIVKNYSGGENAKKDMPIRSLLLKAFVHIFLFLISVPAHVLNTKFLLTLKRPNLKLCLTLCLPLSLFTCLITNPYEFSSLYFWGGSAIAGLLLQAFVATQFVRLDTLTGLLQ